MEYGVGDDECVNLTCKIKGNPEPTTYYWLLENMDAKPRESQPVTLETTEPLLMYKRPNGTTCE